MKGQTKKGKTLKYLGIGMNTMKSYTWPEIIKKVNMIIKRAWIYLTKATNRQ